jgi:hypothetical protein
VDELLAHVGDVHADAAAAGDAVVTLHGQVSDSPRLSIYLVIIM